MDSVAMDSHSEMEKSLTISENEDDFKSVYTIPLKYVGIGHYGFDFFLQHLSENSPLCIQLILES